MLNALKPKLDVFVAALLLAAPTMRGALTPEQVKALPPPADHHIDFKTEIKPIFEASCIRCHGRGRDRGGLRIDSRETLLKGGDSGPAAVAGKSADSYLIALVSGADPDEVMPKKGKKLTPEEVGAAAGLDRSRAAVGPGNRFRPDPAEEPRPAPAGNSGGAATKPIRWTGSWMFISSSTTSSRRRRSNDRIFARRVYLDTIGLLPPARGIGGVCGQPQSRTSARRWSRPALAQGGLRAELADVLERSLAQ